MLSFDVDLTTDDWIQFKFPVTLFLTDQSYPRMRIVDWNDASRYAGYGLEYENNLLDKNCNGIEFICCNAINCGLKPSFKIPRNLSKDTLYVIEIIP